MKPYSFLLFDLDGTLSDPLIGFSNSINYALHKLGYPERESSEIAHYVGPPLDLTFKKLLGDDIRHDVVDLVAAYRERYSTIGYKEHSLYRGIPDTLSVLKSKSIPMGVCTSKREDFAIRIVQESGLSPFFEFVCGADIGSEKWQQIECLKKEGRIPDTAIMIGDRNVDLTAAHRNGLPSAAVLWGYGSRAELEAEHPKHILTQPSDLLQLT